MGEISYILSYSLIPAEKSFHSRRIVIMMFTAKQMILRFALIMQWSLYVFLFKEDVFEKNTEATVFSLR